MAGFILKTLDNKSRGLLSNIQRNIRYLSALGMRWDDKVIKQSKSIGIAEAEAESIYGMYSAAGNYLGTDYGQKEFIAFYDKEYPTRRDFLRRFAMNGEIDHVIEVIADESIIYDESNFFAYPNTRTLKGVLKAEKAKEIVDDLNEAFRKVYFAFGFNEGHDAWAYMKKFLIDGFLAFEIIYDQNENEDAKNVIGFKEIEPISLEPEIRKDEEGKEYRVWIQNKGDASRQRELVDANIIYISWARGNFISRLSYVERLVRSFNMLRTLENSRMIWNVWNSQYRMKIVVPIGTQSEVKARTRLSELRAMYKEDLNIDTDSAEVTFNGQPNFSFFKTYIIPDREGTSTQIDSFQPAGFDLNSTEQLKYFWMRFINDTKVPNNRFRLDIGGGSQAPPWSAGSDALQREELSWSYFINRVRSMFQEIMIKPAWLQFCLMHPEFAKDRSLKASIGLDYVEENLFKQIKLREISEKAASTVNSMLGVREPIINPDGSPGEAPYFDIKFLVEKYFELSDADTKLNNKYKKERREEMLKLAAAYRRLAAAQGTPVGGEAGAGGDTFGGLGGAEAGGFGGGAEAGGGLDLGLGGAEEAPATPPEATPPITGEEPTAPPV